jgi:hypothetical protein
MLFDLRGRGRRRTVRVLYTGLALLMGVGLVGFGIGGGFGSGGILNAASSGEGGGGTSFSRQIKKYEKQTKQQPKNLTAWEKLTEARIHEAGGEAYFTSAGVLTSKGRTVFREASESWSSYLALNPPKPSVKLAKLVLLLYQEGALNEPAKSVEALQIVVAADPESAAFYSELAVAAYQAKNERVGDLSATKAVALAPENAKTRIKKELEEVKKSPGGKVYTTTTNGKTYAVKKAPNGQFTGTEITTTTPPPATTVTTGTTTTTKK